MKVITLICAKKFCSGQMGHFGPKNEVHPHKSESNLRFFLKLCRMKGAHRYMKNLLVVF